MGPSESRTRIPKQWHILPPAPPDLARLLGMPSLWAQLLYNRGITDPAQTQEFLDPKLEDLHDPFLFAEMDRAVTRILQAVQAKETVAVYGDFDTDGVTATALLHDALTTLGARVVSHIPHRVREGHGLNDEAIDKLKAEGASLLITVDCGITAVQEVERARAKGMDIVITDHHVAPARLPLAYAIITPRHSQSRYPYPYLTGAGLAFKVAQALYQTTKRPLEDGLLELAALGTVADMAPLQGENRVLAKAGLEALKRTRRPGLLALLESAGVTPGALDHETIPYVLAPRLNAAGRIDSADLSFQLMTESDIGRAHILAQTLEDQNKQRQHLTASLLAGALSAGQAQVQEGFLLMLAGEEYAPGVNGLVASKLVEAFYRPAVVVALDGDVARGSGRSIPEFNLAVAFSQCADLFQRYGGHPAAAGFVARSEDLPALRHRLQALAYSSLGEMRLPASPVLRIDAEVSIKELLGDTFNFLRSLAPFGQGNPGPQFLTRGVEVVQVRSMGAQGQHLRLTLKSGGATWDAVAFGQGGADDAWIERGEQKRRLLLDVAYTLGVDTFSGRHTVQLQLLDFRSSQGQF